MSRISTPVPPRRGRRAAAALALAAVVLVAGCSDDGGDDDTKDTTTTEATETTEAAAVDPANVSPEDLPDVPELTEPTGIRSDVEVEACAEEAPLAANGTVTNTGDAPADIVISVSWTNDTSDVMARGVAVLEDVAAGAQADWSAESAEEPEAELTCSIKAERGALAG